MHYIVKFAYSNETDVVKNIDKDINIKIHIESLLVFPSASGKCNCTEISNIVNMLFAL